MELDGLNWEIQPGVTARLGWLRLNGLGWGVMPFPMEQHPGPKLPLTPKKRSQCLF